VLFYVVLSFTRQCIYTPNVKFWRFIFREDFDYQLPILSSTSFGKELRGISVKLHGVVKAMRYRQLADLEAKQWRT